MGKSKGKKQDKRKIKKEKGLNKIINTIEVESFKIENEFNEYDSSKIKLKSGIDIENFLRNCTQQSCLADNLLPKRKTAIKRKNKNDSHNYDAKHDPREIVKENRFLIDEYLKPNFESIVFLDKKRLKNLSKKIYNSKLKKSK